MPLLKKKPFALLEPAKDLEPHELVYQIRFTKEIFRDYQNYLNRINLYRQRIWTCKITGKVNLTYEEALVSESNAAEKVQEIPKELVTPALHIIQFSMLPLNDLATKLQDHLFLGAELQGKKGDDVCPCKMLKVLEEANAKTQYEVAWLDENKKMIETSIINGDDLIRKKLPLSRNILKSFIRKSTYRNAPWVIHDKLAQKHGISGDPPHELKHKVFIQNGLVLCSKKRKQNSEDRQIDEVTGKHKKKKVEGREAEFTKVENNNEIEDDQLKEPIKYPIDDLLVQPGADDPIFAERPSPSRDFKVPVDCVGDLLVVWDFCSSFSRLLHLWPFSLEDMENAICHKDSNLALIVETHSALLRLLIRDGGEYLLAIKRKGRKLKITLINWTEYLCDFIETLNTSDLSACITMIKRGHYGLLDVQAKLRILCELVDHALETDILRDMLNEFIEQRRMLGATRREEAIEEARKKREVKERSKAETVVHAVNGHNMENVGKDLFVSANQNHSSQNGEISEKRRGDSIPSGENHSLGEKSETNHLDNASNKMGKKQNRDIEVLEENVDRATVKEPLKYLKGDKKDATEKKTKMQRKEYFEREIEKRVLRTSPLGNDRDYNRYWWFRRDGRIFVESIDSKLWGYYSSREDLDSLMGSLNCKGERERALHVQLKKFHSRICTELQKGLKAAQQAEIDEAVLRRSTRVRALPRENPANAFLKYVNKWKDDLTGSGH